MTRTECYGCGHAPHPAYECSSHPLFLPRDELCRCTLSSAYPDPGASPGWRACLVRNCGHVEREHRGWSDGALCRTCFDLNPSDDSHIEGGVYHRFRS